MLAAVSMAIAAGAYHGNIKSKIFHDADCRYFDCKNCVAVFDTRAEAIEAGYRPCKICKP
jgi:methylphosphotriester-DNA--protein-cysteine methyltransferase